MAKEILGLIKLQIPAGGANPSPPVGPALGQRGLNIMDFCKAFNDKTKDLEKGAPIPVIITAYKDRSFDFTTKLPPVSFYLKKAAKIKKGNSTPGRSLVGKVSMQDIEKIAKKWADKNDFFFIGRGYMYPVALEGALKLKEISYVHAEGYHAAELKHGPIALLEEEVPVIALANDVNGKDKVLGNIQECIARKSPVIITATDGDDDVKGLTEDVIWIPRTSIELSPIPTAVALQLLSYYIARERGCSIDQPRNLAKSVTVE